MGAFFLYIEFSRLEDLNLQPLPPELNIQQVAIAIYPLEPLEK